MRHFGRTLFVDYSAGRRTVEQRIDRQFVWEVSSQATTLMLKSLWSYRCFQGHLEDQLRWGSP